MGNFISRLSMVVVVIRPNAASPRAGESTMPTPASPYLRGPTKVPAPGQPLHLARTKFAALNHCFTVPTAGRLTLTNDEPTQEVPKCEANFGIVKQFYHLVKPYLQHRSGVRHESGDLPKSQENAVKSERTWYFRQSCSDSGNSIARQPGVAAREQAACARLMGAVEIG